MSPLLAALLRQNPTQWAAAADAVAAATRSSLAQRRRRFSLNACMHHLALRSNPPAHATAAFTRVWAEAGRWATTNGVWSSMATAAERGLSTTGSAASAALGRTRVSWILGVLPRAPAALFMLGTHAQHAGVASRRLPNLSGVVVFFLVGGGTSGGLLPNTAHCLERMRGAAGEGASGSGGAVKGGRGPGRDVASDVATRADDGEDAATPRGRQTRSGGWTRVLSSPPAARFFERALTVIRAVQLSILFSPVVVLAPLLLQWEGGAALWYRLLRHTLELGGAAFIKWGQWASTRYDVFPAQLCTELEELQANAPEHSWRCTRQILERAYGGAQRLEEIFDWVEHAPIASGSIAQIHRAKLRPGVAERHGAGPDIGAQARLLRSVGAGVELLANGEWRNVVSSVLLEWRNSAGKWQWNHYTPFGHQGGDDEGSAGGDAGGARGRDAASGGGEGEGQYVAVKVRHPGVVDALRRDFAILMWIASATKNFEFLAPFQLEHTVQQFGVHMLQQVDLTNEASNLTKFRSCFSLWPAVSFPTPVTGLATEEVLVETFEEGVSISNYLMEAAPAAALDEALRAEEEASAGAGAKGKNDDVARESRVDSGTAAETSGAHVDSVADNIPEENRLLAALGVKTLLKMLIDDNFLHADLHPGNILVRFPGGVRGGIRSEGRGEENGGDEKMAMEGDAEGGWKSAEGDASSSRKRPSPRSMSDIVILDAGLATALTPQHQASLAEFFQAIVMWDGIGVANKIISFSSNFSPKFNAEAFKRDVDAAVRQFSESTPRAGDCMAAIFETVQRHHVTLDPNVMVAVVTVMVLEGWQFRLDPSINIMDYIGDVIRTTFRKHQRLTMMDFALRDMWAPFSEPNALNLDRSGRSPMSSMMEAGHGGGWAI